MPKKTITIADIVREFGECEIQDERGIFVPITEDYMKDKFDIDLDFGKVGEREVENLLEGNGKIEVKTERDIWKKTGNIAIELRCKGKPSGVSTTESTVWIHLLAYKGAIEGGFLLKVDELKDKIKKLHNEGNLNLVMGGDDNASQMALLPIKELF